MGNNAISSWWTLAACQSADPELFFPVSGTGLAQADIVKAKAICAGCEIRRRCLDYALESQQVHGVWGGTSEGERQVLSAQHRRDLEQVAV
jgi:WhiB family transcriptional regulator, redox-sensing transcriptional regulator